MIRGVASCLVLVQYGEHKKTGMNYRKLLEVYGSIHISSVRDLLVTTWT